MQASFPVFKIMKEQHTKLNEFLAEKGMSWEKIENVLNIRPLTYANFDDCKIIRPVDFIQPNAPLIISTTDDLDEFNPGKPDMKERLGKYWMGTLKVLDTNNYSSSPKISTNINI
ncbi:unnamed protein product [Onchocerca flexuosa]|uniref:Cytochrome P450 n=1 Tax=Onchocerca flexuosa TaxID=387005 RepID=A0A183H7I4_9BILA|nr:unnamed protein product [Onchocerca flexuosa]